MISRMKQRNQIPVSLCSYKPGGKCSAFRPGFYDLCCNYSTRAPLLVLRMDACHDDHIL